MEARRERPRATAAGAEAETLTVAVTGPTGDIGRALMRALDGEPSVGTGDRDGAQPVRPAGGRAGRRPSTARATSSTTTRSPALVADADVVVHLAFIILGGREETRKINLEGSRNVFEAAVGAGVERLVYTSSVAAYGFHEDNPQPLTEDVEPRGSEGFYYSAQKAELEGAAREGARRHRTSTPTSSGPASSPAPTP